MRHRHGFWSGEAGAKTGLLGMYNTDVQCQKAATTYFTSKQLLLFVFVMQYFQSQKGSNCLLFKQPVTAFWLCIGACVYVVRWILVIYGARLSDNDNIYMRCVEEYRHED